MQKSNSGWNNVSDLFSKVNDTFKKDRCLTRIMTLCDSFVIQCRDVIAGGIVWDAIVLSSNPITYIESNLFQYTIAIIVWILLTRDVFCDVALEADLKESIRSHGLSETVNMLRSYASDVLNKDEAEQGEMNVASWAVFPVLSLKMDITRAKLTWFRFLSRFTPIKADRFERQATIDFFNVNSSIVLDDYQRKGWYLATNLSKGFLSRIMPFHFNPHSFEWSNGSCNDGRTVLEKLRSFAKYSASLEHWSYPLSGGRVERYPFHNYVEPLCVPKSLKGPRIIAPVSSFTAALSHQLRKHLTSELKRLTGIDLSTQQEVNRDEARKASASGKIFTIDESHASDSISWYVYKRIFPRNIVCAMSVVREHIFCNKYRCVVVKMAFASGNPSTFVSETMFFYAILEMAADYYELFSEEHTRVHDKIGAYGDDLYVPEEILQTVLDLLEIFGITVNYDKSCLNSEPGSFRESCGGEFINGESVEPYYWPRREVSSESPSKAAMLLASLHNKLFTYRNTRSFLKHVVLRLYPKMTRQTGFSYDDLHDTLDELSTRIAPVGEFVYTPGHAEWQEYTHNYYPQGVNRNWLSAVPTTVKHRKYLGFIPDKEELVTDWKKVLKMSESEQPSEYLLREVHTALTTVYKPYSYDEDVEMLLYVDFLKNGPYFETALDELLGVSTPRLERRTLADLGQEVIRTVVR